jgi:hypothetical protein
MTETLRVRAPIIDPIYRQNAPNEPIEFGHVQIQFDHRGNVHEDTATARLIFQPKDEMRFVCPLDDKPWNFPWGLMQNGPEKRITLPDRKIGFDATFVTSGERHGGIVFSPTRSAVTVTPPSTSITRCIFHVFNFPKFIASDDYILLVGEEPHLGGCRCGRIALEFADWELTIAATGETGDLVDELEFRGGYLLTHVGRVIRKDGTAFSSDELNKILLGLHYFLSFALGRWGGTALPVGFNSSGERCHEEWGIRMTADGAWGGSGSWFDAHHGDLLVQVFPGFMSLWTSELWKEPLSHALYWYLGACDRRIGVGVDTGLILAQTALESLAWTYCVRDRKLASADDFGRRGLPAAEKMRLLISTLDIPLEIPPELRALHAKRGKKWSDGPDAITGIRNSLVHPGSRAKLPKGSYLDAWRLSLWYIDLVLLRLCNHQGSYANRLKKRWVGMVEPVPWKPIGAA